MVAYDGGVPPLNSRRRADLADAALALLAEAGVHGVTHRAVEKRAGLPAGTASNYFRSREALLVAAAERLGDLHYADMEAAAIEHRPAARSKRQQATDLIAHSLLDAATIHRVRYIAIFELRMESLRRPAVAVAMTTLFERSVAVTTSHHASLGLDIPKRAVPMMLTLYGGALFTLVTSPPEHVSADLVCDIAAGIVDAALDR
ncbi:TetR family transcriptional regulator [Asanoa siamensis]|uniref:TetR family transcriptional regulator n=2 Tax=Asanoa siamensis TaxID=926357 RepID=A0ABQ4D1M6_9ACTN|nr:TetR family transcriptional regulator [Asanoa siamensis]